MSHKYSIDQLAHPAGAHFADRTSGIYEVVHLMSESKDKYSCRIRNTATGAERAVPDPRIRAVDVRQDVHPSAAAGSF